MEGIALSTDADAKMGVHSMPSEKITERNGSAKAGGASRKIAVGGLNEPG